MTDKLTAEQRAKKIGQTIAGRTGWFQHNLVNIIMDAISDAEREERKRWEQATRTVPTRYVYEGKGSPAPMELEPDDDRA